jgi:SAM-dependent methyltransferase
VTAAVTATASGERCVACGAAELVAHLRVAGGEEPDELVPTTDRFGSALADIVRCRVCGHGQLARFPEAAFLAGAYGQAADGAYIEEEAGQRATARATLERIERHVAAGALLDAGCWVGFLLDESRRRGWRAIGVEPSAYASAFARDRLGVDVVRADLFSAQLPHRAFEAIVLADVLEHLVDPGAALDRLAELLAPGGVVAFLLPDAGSRVARALGARWWSVIPTHVQYFTRGSLRTLLARHRWEVLELGTAPKAFTVRYYLSRIGGYSPALGRAAVGVAARLGLAERMWAPDFRDRMAVVARPAGYNSSER